jgi:hypothetical protein
LGDRTATSVEVSFSLRNNSDRLYQSVKVAIEIALNLYLALNLADIEKTDQEQSKNGAAFAFHRTMNQPDEHQQLKILEWQIATTESYLSQLNVKLADAKNVVQDWVKANSALSQSAAEKRAETQSMGRGLGGALLGAHYRAVSRRHAASINAGIAREVASKRATIKQGKQNAQDVVKRIQVQITQAKDKLKHLKAQKGSISSSAKKSTQSAQASSRSLVLLEKLNEAYQLGLLTQKEYEEKRKKIADQI